MGFSDRQNPCRRASATGRRGDALQRVGVAGGVDGDPVFDVRYRALVGAAAWSRLPAAVRSRFSKKIPVGGEQVYRGCVIRSQISFVGRILVHALRIIGGPLPISRRVGGRVVVTVRECVSGQEWTRTYDGPGQARRQVVRSFKRFGGPTGLEERVGFGIGMRLVVEGLLDGLAFRSDGYFWAPLHGRGIVLPGWLTPGQLTVIHREIESDVFDFELELVHPVMGVLMRHCVRFSDAD